MKLKYLHLIILFGMFLFLFSCNMNPGDTGNNQENNNQDDWRLDIKGVWYFTDSLNNFSLILSGNDAASGEYMVIRFQEDMRCMVPVMENIFISEGTYTLSSEGDFEITETRYFSEDHWEEHVSPLAFTGILEQLGGGLHLQVSGVDISFDSQAIQGDWRTGLSNHTWTIHDPAHAFYHFGPLDSGQGSVNVEIYEFVGGRITIQSAVRGIYTLDVWGNIVLGFTEIDEHYTGDWQPLRTPVGPNIDKRLFLYSHEDILIMSEFLDEDPLVYSFNRLEFFE
ncbi:MAG: hypothetical protein MJB14_01175 [Spirochaetes bacterium]|nr:hypothetical protein [Spirochaetota bacterium]